MQVALIGGAIISVPNILYQIWAFIAPGLLPTNEIHPGDCLLFILLLPVGHRIRVFYHATGCSLSFFFDLRHHRN